MVAASLTSHRTPHASSSLVWRAVRGGWTGYTRSAPVSSRIQPSPDGCLRNDARRAHWPGATTSLSNFCSSTTARVELHSSPPSLPPPCPEVLHGAASPEAAETDGVSTNDTAALTVGTACVCVRVHDSRCARAVLITVGWNRHGGESLLHMGGGAAGDELSGSSCAAGPSVPACGRRRRRQARAARAGDSARAVLRGHHARQASHHPVRPPPSPPSHLPPIPQRLRPSSSSSCATHRLCGLTRCGVRWVCRAVTVSHRGRAVSRLSLCGCPPRTPHWRMGEVAGLPPQLRRGMAVQTGRGARDSGMLHWRWWAAVSLFGVPVYLGIRISASRDGRAPSHQVGWSLEWLRRLQRPGESARQSLARATRRRLQPRARPYLQDEAAGGLRRRVAWRCTVGRVLELCEETVCVCPLAASEAPRRSPTTQGGSHPNACRALCLRLPRGWCRRVVRLYHPPARRPTKQRGRMQWLGWLGWSPSLFDARDGWR